MLKEFKEFAIKGNIFDMAVGVIVGGAFQKIVTSLVNDVIMPAVSIFTGNVDFSSLAINIGDVSIKYGNLITSVVDFLIIAFSIFIIIRYINKLNKKVGTLTAKEMEKLNKKLNKKAKKKKEEPIPEPTTKICPYCLSEINIKATRCAHCTSEQPELNKDENLIDEQLEIEEEINV